MTASANWRTDLRRRIVRRLNSDEWMERHFGIAAHAGDVADAVLEVLAEPTEADPMPVFVIKAKDRLAAQAVVAYGELCRAYGLHDQAAEVDKALADIAAWRDRNPDRVKLPDHPHVAVAATDVTS